MKPRSKASMSSGRSLMKCGLATQSSAVRMHIRKSSWNTGSSLVSIILMNHS